MTDNRAIGIDVGGTGIKMAQVDTSNGQLLSERIKVLTPPLGHPDEIALIIQRTILEHNWVGDVGVGFPTPIRQGRCFHYSNLNPEWEGMHLEEFFGEKLGRRVVAANDVDVAAYAESLYGDVPKGLDKILFLALGTGIGSALIFREQLVRGTELGHLKFKGGIAEDYASNRVREVQGLSWQKWARRLSKVLNHYDFVLDIDHFILGGGVSKKFDKFKDFLKIEKPVQPATLQNKAGVIGAALLTTECQ
jgi:polyphosphate glucokinase